MMLWERSSALVPLAFLLAAAVALQKFKILFFRPRCRPVFVCIGQTQDRLTAHLRLLQQAPKQT